MRISDWSSDVCSSDLVVVWAINVRAAEIHAAPRRHEVEALEEGEGFSWRNAHLDGAHRCRSRLKFSRSKEVCHQRHVSHRGAPVLSGSDPESYDTLVTFGLPQGHQIISKRHVVGTVRRTIGRAASRERGCQ